MFVESIEIDIILLSHKFNGDVENTPNNLGRIFVLLHVLHIWRWIMPNKTLSRCSSSYTKELCGGTDIFIYSAQKISIYLINRNADYNKNSSDWGYDKKILFFHDPDHVFVMHFMLKPYPLWGIFRTCSLCKHVWVLRRFSFKYFRAVH